ncbi:MAG: alpha/beta hydrolase [Candidatus Binatia bacterium]
MTFPRELGDWVPLRSDVHALDPDVVYTHVEGTPLRYDRYRPVAATGPTPVLVFVHGGSWARGDPSHAGPNAVRFARMGITTISVSYRLAPAHRFPAQLEDVLRGLRHVLRHARELSVDPERLALGGMSAGSYLALLAHVTPGISALAAALPADLVDAARRIRALVLQQGPYDLANRTPYADGTDPIANLLGPRGDDEAWVRTVSPVHHVEHVTAPVLLVHGTADDVVRPRQSERLHRQLADAGKPCELLLVEGAGHAFQLAWESEANQRSNAAMEDFLARHLLGEAGT